MYPNRDPAGFGLVPAVSSDTTPSNARRTSPIVTVRRLSFVRGASELETARNILPSMIGPKFGGSLSMPPL